MAKDIKDVAIRYLEHREHSSYEVKGHLKTKGYSEQEISEVLDYLVGFHYVDDERYCDSYMRYGISKGKGPIRLQYELTEKGIRSELIESALEEYYNDNTEKESARAEAQKICMSGGKSLDRAVIIDEKTLAKIGRRLSGLGYHTSVIYDIIGQLRKS